MRLSTFRAALGALLALASTTAFAQDWRGTGRIEASVVSETGEPIPGATLKANCASRGGGTALKSDKKGRFGPRRGGRLQLGHRHHGRRLRAACDLGAGWRGMTARAPRQGHAQAPRRRRRRRAPRPRVAGARRESRGRLRRRPLRGGGGRSTKSCSGAPGSRGHDPPADRLHVRSGEAVRQGGRAPLEKVLAADPSNAQVRAITAQAALRARCWTRRGRCSPGSTNRRSTAPRRLLQHGDQLLQRRRDPGVDRLLRQGGCEGPRARGRLLPPRARLPGARQDGGSQAAISRRSSSCSPTARWRRWRARRSAS